MAPKRRAASSTKANKTGGKKVKQEPDTPKDAFTSAKEALKAAGPEVKGKRKADEHCLLSEQHSGRVSWTSCHIKAGSRLFIGLPVPPII